MFNLQVNSEQEFNTIIDALRHYAGCDEWDFGEPRELSSADTNKLADRLEEAQGREELLEGMKNAPVVVKNPCDKHKPKE